MEPVFHQGRLHTPNLRPGVKVYGERLTRLRGQEIREWSARRSKLAAYMARGGRRFHVIGHEDVLYLGAASGTTVSHLSDLLPKGRIFSIEFSARPFRDLITLAAQRPNIVPILSDASKPDAYAPFLLHRVPIVYQDIAQRNQAQIFAENLRRFLGQDGVGFLAVKARSINVAEAPRATYEAVRKDLTARGFETVETTELDPYERDHAMLVVKARPAPPPGKSEKPSGRPHP
jgi:fibrillarin-like pre-rRNA processing protein